MSTAREATLAALGYEAVPTPDGDAGEFTGRVRWAHPLDALVEMIDPMTGKPYLTSDEYDAGMAFAFAFHRGGIRRRRGGLEMIEPSSGDQTDESAEQAAKFREMCRQLGQRANLAIDVCCEARMPSELQSRELARALDHLV